MSIQIMFNLLIIILINSTVSAAPVSETNLSTSTTMTTTIVPTVASVQILSTCKDGEYFKRDCKLYISCERGKWRRNFCSENKYWNQAAKKCDDINNVPECYEMYMNIRRNARSMLMTKQSSQSSNDKLIESLKMINNSDEYEDEEDDDDDDFDDNDDNDDDDNDDNSNNNNKNTIYSSHDQKPMVNTDVPYFSSKDYEDYDDNDDDEEEKNKQSNKLLFNKEKIEIISRSKKRNNLNHQDKNQNKNQINDQMLKTTKPAPIQSYGKICIVRGKQIECHYDNDNGDGTTTTTTTTTTTPSTTTTTTTESTDKQSIDKCNNNKLTDINNNNNNRNIHSYSIKIQINIDDRIFDRFDRLFTIIYYYISFQFM